MNAFSRMRVLGRTAASTALVAGSIGLTPGVATAAGTVLADQNNCTVSNVTYASNQMQEPWEVAGLAGSLTDAIGNQLDGSGVKVAVIDTGIQTLSGQLAADGGETLNGEATGYGTDDDGHGTMVASIIAAKKESGSTATNAMEGLAPGVQLLSFREAGCRATKGNNEDSMAQAINDAVNDGADVINISQDGYADQADLSEAVLNAWNRGVLIVTSSGNQGDRDTTDNSGKDYGVNPKTYPASYQPYVLAVGAVDQYGTVPTFSETGSYIGVVAPGVGVGGLAPNNKVAIDDGTSFASPYVAAEAALIMQEHHWAGSGHANPSRAYEVMKIIEATAQGNGSYSTSMGWGAVDIQSALHAQLTNGDQLVSFPDPVPGLPTMVGSGPDADRLAPTQAAAGDVQVVKPFSAGAGNQQAQSQQRWAYIALALGLLVALVTLAGAAVMRDATRRRANPPA